MSATIQPIVAAPRDSWRAVGRAVGMFIAYAFSLAAASLPVAIVFFLFSWLVNHEEPREISLHLEDALLWLNAFAALLALLAALVFASLAVRWVDRRGSLRDLGFAVLPNTRRVSLVGAMAAIVLIGVVFAAQSWLGWARVTDLMWQREGWGDVIGDFFGTLLLVASAALGEELVFRGYVRFTLTDSLGARGALVVSAILFALFRVFGGVVTRLGSAELILAGVTALVAGMVLGGLFLIGKSLWAPVAAHFAWSFVGGFVFSLPIAGTPVDGLIGTQVSSGLVTGGRFGPEGGLIGLIVLALAGMIVWVAMKRLLWTKLGLALD